MVSVIVDSRSNQSALPHPQFLANRQNNAILCIISKVFRFLPGWLTIPLNILKIVF